MECGAIFTFAHSFKEARAHSHYLRRRAPTVTQAAKRVTASSLDNGR